MTNNFNIADVLASRAKNNKGKAIPLEEILGGVINGTRAERFKRFMLNHSKKVMELQDDENVKEIGGKRKE